MSGSVCLLDACRAADVTAFLKKNFGFYPFVADHFMAGAGIAFNTTWGFEKVVRHSGISNSKHLIRKICDYICALKIKT